MAVFEDQVETSLQEIVKAHKLEVLKTGASLANEMVTSAERKADKWRRAAEMSEADNKRLRAKVQELSKQLNDTKKEKAGLEGKLRKAEEKAREKRSLLK